MTKLDELIVKYTASGAGVIPGVVLNVIDKDGKSLLSKTSGFTSHLPDAGLLNPSHIFRQASATKLLTSICALQLVQNDTLTLDDPIDSHLPELASQQILTIKPDGSFSFTPPKNKITLRMLLSHTSGLGYDIVDPRLQAWRKSRGEKPQALKGNVTYMIQQPLLFEPGEGWMYGASTDAIGVLISRVTKMSLEEYMRKNIFEPLGMKSSTFFIKKHPELEKRLVPITQRSVDGGLEAGKSSHGDEPKEESGGGGIYVSAEDYLAVLKDLMQPEPKVLSAVFVEMLFKESQLKEGSPAMTHFKRALPMLTFTLSVLVKDVEINQSLGGLLITGKSPHLGETQGTLAWAGALTFEMKTDLAASFAAVVRDDAAVSMKAAVLSYKLDEIRQAVAMLDEYIRITDGSEKDSQLAQVRQILVVLDFGIKNGARYFKALPALYEALEKVPWTQGARYRVDDNLQKRDDDKSQVAARLQRTLNWLELHAKFEFEAIADDLKDKDAYAGRTFALSDFKKTLMDIMFRANNWETQKIREISAELAADGDVDKILQWIGVW